MNSKKINWPVFILLFVLLSCNTSSGKENQENTAQQNWKQQFDKTLPLLGHRNWILVVDKAFPEQNAIGMEYINTNENLLSVLEYVLAQVNKSTHVKPIIYTDKELSFITEEQSKGVKHFAETSQKIFGNKNVNTLLHDSVFTKLDSESKLFKVLVIKTNEIIPYTSVFLQLDCAYWNGEQESQLRATMKKE